MNFQMMNLRTSHRSNISHVLSIVSILLLTTTLQYSNGQYLKVNSVPGDVAPISGAPAQIVSDDFSPLVSARCERGIMYVTVATAQPFWGVAHTRDQRKRSPCIVTGNGALNTTLKISLLAQEGDELFCGVQRHKGERSVALAVRAHKSLELSEDRFFYLTCHTHQKTIKGGTYRVNLKLVGQDGEKATKLTHGEPYKLAAELLPKDSVTTLRMRSCFIFGKSTDQIELIDRHGCPTSAGLIQQFNYNDSSTAEATIPAMFKFSDEAKVNFQCDALICRDGCDEPNCDANKNDESPEVELDGYTQVSASTSALIREPTAESENLEHDEFGECTEWRFPWLITLCICLAIMLLVMLLLNLFMCSSMSCRCIKTEADEKVQDFDDYDPYRADWTAPNSLHGSRYSLERHNRGHDNYATTDDQSTAVGSMESIRDPHHHHQQPQQPQPPQRQRQIPIQQSQPTRYGRHTPDSDDDYTDDERHRSTPRPPQYHNQYATSNRY